MSFFLGLLSGARLRHAVALAVPLLLVLLLFLMVPWLVAAMVLVAIGGGRVAKQGMLKHDP